MSRAQAEAHVTQAFDVGEQRNRVKWTVDLSVIPMPGSLSASRGGRQFGVPRRLRRQTTRGRRGSPTDLHLGRPGLRPSSDATAARRLLPRSCAHSTENAGQLTVVSPLIFAEVLVDSDQPEDLSSWGLKVEVRVLHVKYPDAEGDDFLPHFFDVVGLQLQVGRF